MESVEQNGAPKSGRKSRTRLATLEDVARAVGVTPKTVSRAINNNGYVAPATRDKVLRAAKELNYAPNLAAQTLATGKTGVIAVVSPRLDQPEAAHLVYLMEMHLRASGYQLKHLYHRDQLHQMLRAPNSLAADGLIVNGMHDLLEETEFADSSLSRNCVFLDTYEQPNSDYVRIDVRTAVKEALHLMIAQGCTRIAYVGIADDVPFDPALVAGDRLATYLAVMQDTGRTPEFINARDYLVPRAERVESLKRYFRDQGCPDALLCLHDEIAMMANRALVDCGYRIPEDVALVGGDGLFMMEYFNPPLSAIVQPLEEACDLAWKFLQARMAQPHIPLQQATLQAKLAVRKSLQL